MSVFILNAVVAGVAIYNIVSLGTLVNSVTCDACVTETNHRRDVATAGCCYAQDAECAKRTDSISCWSPSCNRAGILCAARLQSISPDIELARPLTIPMLQAYNSSWLAILLTVPLMLAGLVAGTMRSVYTSEWLRVCSPCYVLRC